ncbi:hypothetical protein [Thiocapsa roseopersicina]|uniref:Uncharacterized protein n=1 Tax=Thiocapsa roseopersicina TaxID=1058 RepID=A0A1H3A150_THIRO|nr:hypothetical protein [Thiocapsa roseopersicina]SDX23356.1 hypothetical protein SAMN05421783_1182 [Thiocapsa roseopersicina]
MKTKGKDEIVRKIAKELASGRDPDLMDERVGVPKTTWNRWIRQAREAAPEAVKAAMKTKAGRKNAIAAERAVVAHLSAAASVDKKGIDILLEVDSLLADCLILRNAAFTKDKDGNIGTELKEEFGPGILRDAIKSKVAVLTAASKIIETLMSGQRVAATQAAIVEAVEAASPEAKVKLVEAFRGIQARYGMIGPAERPH